LGDLKFEFQNGVVCVATVDRLTEAVEVTLGNLNVKFQIVVVGVESIEGAIVVIIDLIINVAGLGLGCPVSLGTSLGSVFTEGEDVGYGPGYLGLLDGLNGHRVSSKVEFNEDKG